MERTLIVGLGNPDPKYTANRHNIGFMVLDRLADRAGLSMSKTKFRSRYATGQFEGKSVVVLKPQTYMNLSGRAVVPAQRFFDIEATRILVVHDELDLPFGKLRLKVGGGHAGHNGLRSMISEMGTNGFSRLRVGIGRPSRGDVSSYVLSDFAAGEEREWLPDLIDRACDAITMVVRKGTQAAMNEVNAT
ncbi:MAG: aminoacyl-tRNA hydrolase [Myxococcota bacterium]|nr:aminoacyl-tRNA hydrolase [Myxococcota bacterium]